jgi:hypothetical protein
MKPILVAALFFATSPALAQTSALTGDALNQAHDICERNRVVISKTWPSSAPSTPGAQIPVLTTRSHGYASGFESCPDIQKAWIAAQPDQRGDKATLQGLIGQK